MNKPLTIWALCDGKPGHENQSIGLTDAIAKQTDTHIEYLDLAGLYGIGCRVRRAFALAESLATPPDLLIAAGHSMHLSLLFLARKWNAPAVVIMKPTLPYALFDACLVPIHDLRAPDRAPCHVLPTLGALNRVQANPAAHSRTRNTILIGGPSKHFSWNAEELLAHLREIFTNSPGSWIVADSRRTPLPFAEQFSQKFPQVTYVPQSQTDATWLPEQLSYSQHVWVTEDSVSMVHEALSSGARVGILPMPRAKHHSRLAKGVQALVDRGYVTPFSRWSHTHELASPPRILQEADRAATWILAQFFPNRA